MKKLSIAAICAASLASACIAAPTFAADSATISFSNENLYSALKNHAHITTEPDDKVIFVDKGGDTPSSTATSASIVYGYPIIGIEFDCTDGNPLEGITDFSDLDKFKDLKNIVICDDIDYDFADSVNVYTVRKHAPQGELAISDELANAFEGAKYEYYNPRNTDGIISSHANTYVLVNSYTENVKTITFDCSKGDPLASLTSHELTGAFAMFPNAQTVYVCGESYDDLMPEDVKAVNQNAVKIIPAGDYTLDYDDFMENGVDAKLLTKDGKDSGYTLGDLQAFVKSIEEDENSEYSIVEMEPTEEDGTKSTAKILKNGEDYITFSFDISRLAKDVIAALAEAFKDWGDGIKIEFNEEAVEAESTENPDTADDFTGIIAAIALSGVALGAGVFAATRRR